MEISAKVNHTRSHLTHTMLSDETPSASATSLESPVDSPGFPPEVSSTISQAWRTCLLCVRTIRAALQPPLGDLTEVLPNCDKLELLAAAMLNAVTVTNYDHNEDMTLLLTYVAEDAAAIRQVLISGGPDGASSARRITLQLILTLYTTP